MRLTGNTVDENAITCEKSIKGATAMLVKCIVMRANSSSFKLVVSKCQYNKVGIVLSLSQLTRAVMQSISTSLLLTYPISLLTPPPNEHPTQIHHDYTKSLIVLRIIDQS